MFGFKRSRSIFYPYLLQLQHYTSCFKHLYNLASPISPHLLVFGLWEETWAPEVNPSKRIENMQSSHRKYSDSPTFKISCLYRTQTARSISSDHKSEHLSQQNNGVHTCADKAFCLCIWWCFNVYNPTFKSISITTTNFLAW